MKISLKNIGPIHNLEFDFSKKLQLIFGKNNIGKSYSVNVIYCFIKSFIENKRLMADIGSPYRGLSINKEFKDNKEFKKLNKKIVAALKREKKENLELNQYAEEVVASVLSKSFLKDFAVMLSTIVSQPNNIKNQYSKADGEIIIDLDQITISIEINRTDSIRVKKIELKNRYWSKMNDLGFKVYKDDTWIFGCVSDYIVVSLAEDIISRIIVQISAYVDKVYFLPASRSGLYPAINSFGPILAELAKSRYFIKNRKIELPTLSEITSSYYLDLSTISGEKIWNDNLHILASEIERKLLKGKVRFDPEEERLIYNPENTQLNLELSETSSMVAEISPIVTYLRYILKSEFSEEEQEVLFSSEVDEYAKMYKVNLLIIEEPEAHLHPEAQIVLMDIFTKLSKENIRLIITSHSNYMFNKLGNLILDQKVEYGNIGTYHLKMTAKGSVDVKDMHVYQDGIEDHNFVDVSELLYNERINLLEKFDNTDAE